MESVESKVVEWAMSKIDSYDNEKKLYNLSAILLSILDVVCGIIAIFYTAMAVTSVNFMRYSLGRSGDSTYKSTAISKGS